MARTVEFHIDSGSLRIVGSPDGDQRVGRVVMGHASDAVISVGDDCRVQVHGDHVDVRVENVAGLEAHLDSGSVEARDIAGPVEIHTDCAEVALENVAGDLVVSSDSGDVEALRVCGRIEINAGPAAVTLQAASDRVEVCADSGEVILDLVPLGRRARYEVNADTAPVTVRLPAGTGVRAELETETGDVMNATDAGDEVELAITTDSGDITVLAGVPAFG